MFALLLAPVLVLAPPASSTDAESPTTEEVDLSRAARLFDEGLTRYEAADYEAAIEIFTQALSELRGQGVDDFRIRGLLLFNIGRAHMRAYEIDREVEHLRQAKAIFTRFIDGAAHAGDGIIAAEDIGEAEQQLQTIDALLRELEANEPDATSAAVAESSLADRGAPGDAAAATRARRLGIGLTATGAALLGGGVGLLVWGAQFGPRAEDEVAELDALGLPSDHPAYAEGDTFIADERRKGTTWMAAGGVAAGLGVVGIAVGVQQLVKAKRLGAVELTPVAHVDRRHLVLGVSGRF